MDFKGFKIQQFLIEIAGLNATTKCGSKMLKVVQDAHLFEAEILSQLLPISSIILLNVQIIPYCKEPIY